MVSEKQLQQAVIQLATLRGWKVAHFGNTVKIVRRNGNYKTIPDKQAAGFPDLVMARQPVVMFAELKTKNGQLSDEQMDWGSILSRCGWPEGGGRKLIEYHVWRPADWESGVIERRLK